MLQTVITTIRDKYGSAPSEPQAAPAPNPHFQFGAHLGGGSLQWHAVGNAGSLTVAPPPGTSSSYTVFPAAAPTSLPLPPIEDRSEAPSLAAAITNPFPGPVSTGKGYGKASPVVPDQSPDSLPPASVPPPTSTAINMIRTRPLPVVSIMESLIDGSRKGALDLSPQTKGAATYSCTEPLCGKGITLRPYKPGSHSPKPLTPKRTNIRLPPSASSLRVKSDRIRAILPGPRIVPPHARATPLPTVADHVSLPPSARSAG